MSRRLWRDRQAVGFSADDPRSGRLADSVLFEAGVKLGAREAQEAGGPGLVALGLAQSLLDHATLHVFEIHTLGGKRRRRFRRAVRRFGMRRPDARGHGGKVIAGNQTDRKSTRLNSSHLV